jgi:hypothetical protein
MFLMLHIDKDTQICSVDISNMYTNIATQNINTNSIAMSTIPREKEITFRKENRMFIRSNKHKFL